MAQLECLRISLFSKRLTAVLFPMSPLEPHHAFPLIPKEGLHSFLGNTAVRLSIELTVTRHVSAHSCSVILLFLHPSGGQKVIHIPPCAILPLDQHCANRDFDIKMMSQTQASLI